MNINEEELKTLLIAKKNRDSGSLSCGVNDCKLCGKTFGMFDLMQNICFECVRM